jgi:hypothetical protein
MAGMNWLKMCMTDSCNIVMLYCSLTLFQIQYCININVISLFMSRAHLWAVSFVVELCFTEVL